METSLVTSTQNSDYYHDMGDGNGLRQPLHCHDRVSTVNDISAMHRLEGETQLAILLVVAVTLHPGTGQVPNQAPYTEQVRHTLQVMVVRC